MRRATIALLPLCLLSVMALVPMNALALDTLTLSLSCSDPGASFTVDSDLATATALGNAVQAMSDYPAGITCGLSQTALLGTSSGGSKDFAVMGGQYTTACPNPADGFLVVNLSFSAHVDSGSTTSGVGGTINQTLPEGQCAPQSHLKASVICLQVTGHEALLTGNVTESFGVVGSPPGFQPRGFVVHATDYPDMPDTVQPAASPTPLSSCSSGVSGASTVTHGDIVIQDADGV